ncbi:MAG: hypothetical protein QM726_23530 [Chitinophagaceae bacterium]
MQTTTKPLDKNIQFLIDANYQRMVTFEQAAFLTNEPSFKEFYLAKAEESEINIQQLYVMLHMQPVDSASSNTHSFLANLFNGKKSTIKILESIKTLEKTIGKWYKTTIGEIKDLPNEIKLLVEEQYKLQQNAQLQLEHL